MPVTARKLYLVVAVAFAWVALALQFYLAVNRSVEALPFVEAVIRFASFFTVTTNTLVAVLLSLALIRPGDRSPNPPIMAAATVYIVIVCIIYYVLLSKTWNPQGAQLAANVGLHYVMPAVMAIYWIVFVPKGETQWHHAGWWLLYPFGFFVFTLLEGLRVHWYPYPFIDVNALGYQRVVINGAVLLGFFLGLNFIMIALDRALGRNRAVQAA